MITRSHVLTQKHNKCSRPNFPMWTYTIFSSTKVLIYLIETNQLGSPWKIEFNHWSIFEKLHIIVYLKRKPKSNHNMWLNSVDSYVKLLTLKIQ